MERVYWKKIGQTMFVLLSGLLLFLTFFFVHADAKESRTVRVAFFPMEGFHTYSQKDGYGGVDADYLKELCRHTEWKVEYVQCILMGVKRFMTMPHFPADIRLDVCLLKKTVILPLKILSA